MKLTKLQEEAISLLFITEQDAQDIIIAMGSVTETTEEVIDYLNKKLKIIYSLKNNPDDPFVATIRKEKLVKNGHVTLRKDGNEKCYEFYFDSNNYHFEIWVFLTEDKRIFLTDWPEDRNRTEEIANYN